MYAKLFEQIYDSSIADNWRTRVVFQDMLILADSDGVVDRTAEAIAARTRVPIKMVRVAIKELESPDPRSRTPDAQGKRLLRIDPNRDWGWKIVNYERYRAMKDEFDRKSYMRRYMRDRRSKPEEPVLNFVNNQSNILDDIPSLSESSELKGDARGIDKALEIYQLYPRKVARPKAIKAINKVLQTFGYELVKKATSGFADAWKGATQDDMKFCPHPSTWYNEERFNDSPETWQRRNGIGNGQVSPQQQKKAIEDVLATHPCNKQSVKHDPAASQILKDEYKHLRVKLTELNRTVALGNQ